MESIGKWRKCVIFCEGIQRGGEIYFTLYLSWVGRRSESLWLGTNQSSLEDEGVAARVCDEEDSEGLILFRFSYTKISQS